MQKAIDAFSAETLEKVRGILRKHKIVPITDSERACFIDADVSEEALVELRNLDVKINDSLVCSQDDL